MTLTNRDVHGLGWSSISSALPGSRELVVVLVLHLGGDVGGGVEPAATTEGPWPELVPDVFS